MAESVSRVSRTASEVRTTRWLSGIQAAEGPIMKANSLGSWKSRKAMTKMP